MDWLRLVWLQPKQGDLTFPQQSYQKYKEIKITESLSGEGIVLTDNKAKGVIVKGIKEEDKSQSFINKEITKGNLNDFSTGRVMVGGELAYNLNLEIVDAEFHLFPNPTEDLVYLTTQYNGIISVYNLLGEVLEVKKHRSSMSLINLEFYSPGIYVIQFNSDELVYTKKIQKK